MSIYVCVYTYMYIHVDIDMYLYKCTHTHTCVYYKPIFCSRQSSVLSIYNYFCF